jgi:CBS domain-containing protein
MRVEEVMTEAKCCGREATVRDAAKLMKEENIGFVPICDDQRKPLGAITDRDLAIRVLAEGRSGDERVEAFMTREIVSCRIGDDLEAATRLMREQRKSRVMVCDEQGKLVGVISLQDLTEATSDEETGETLQDVKSDQPPAAH